MSAVADAVQRRVPLRAWALLAAANVAYALVQTTQPARALDLQTMTWWSGDWLIGGVDQYSRPIGPDYPPHALVALSPLAVLPDPAAIALWAALNLALLVAAPILAARVARPGASRPHVLLLVLMFLCWSGSKTLLQFTLLSLVLGLAALAFADSRPAWSGVALGFALMKPQIAAPVFLWMVCMRRWRVVLAALATIGAGTAMYCLRVQEGVVSVAVHYLGTLRSLYLGEAAFTGASHLRPLIGLAVTDAAALDRWVVGVALVLLAVAVAAAIDERRRTGSAHYAALGLAGLWSLLTFYHLTYSFVLLLPAAAWLLLDHDAATARWRLATLWILQVGLMVDVPGVMRRVKAIVPALEPLDAVLSHTDRFLMLFQFVAFLEIARAKHRD